jgi:hypothetical protein
MQQPPAPGQHQQPQLANQPFSRAQNTGGWEQTYERVGEDPTGKPMWRVNTSVHYSLKEYAPNGNVSKEHVFSSPNQISYCSNDEPFNPVPALVMVLNQFHTGLANQHSAGLVNQRPTGSVNQHPPGLINQRPAGFVNQQPGGLVNQRPAGLVNQHPGGLVNRRPAYSVNQYPADSVNQCEAGSVDQHPTGPAIQHQNVPEPPKRRPLDLRPPQSNGDGKFRTRVFSDPSSEDDDLYGTKKMTAARRRRASKTDPTPQLRKSDSYKKPKRAQPPPPRREQSPPPKKDQSPPPKREQSPPLSPGDWENDPQTRVGSPTEQILDQGLTASASNVDEQLQHHSSHGEVHSNPQAELANATARAPPVFEVSSSRRDSRACVGLEQLSVGRSG